MTTQISTTVQPAFTFQQLSSQQLPFSRTLRRVAGVLSCGVVAAVGLVSPALAADRDLWMHDGDFTTVSGYFFAGERIYGDCDGDCYDLDLFLYSSSGSLVDSDQDWDAYPIVSAPYSGYFDVEVYIPSCDHSAGCAVSINSDHSF